MQKKIEIKERGCLEARMAPAAKFAASQLSLGETLDLNLIMSGYHQKLTNNTNQNYKMVYDDLTAKNYWNKLCLYKDEQVPLTKAIISEYMRETLGQDAFDEKAEADVEDKEIKIIDKFEMVNDEDKKTTANFYLLDRLLANCDITADNDKVFFKFTNKEEAEVLFNEFKNILAIDTLGLDETSIIQKSEYTFELSVLAYNSIKAQYKKDKALQPFPHTDAYLIKAIPHEKNYFRAFVDNLIPTAKKDKPRLRPSAKKEFTVTGHGVFLRKEKLPHYTPETKQNFTVMQSTSYITKKVQAPVFGFNKDRRNKLVGVAIGRKDVLLSHRMFVYDGGTISRPYDHHSKKSAEAYHKKYVSSAKPKLFADEDKFTQAISSDKYNEALARIRWNMDGSSHIFIGSDTLEARILAQDYARSIRRALKQQCEQQGRAWDENYQVPIYFYLPGNQNHNSIYNIFDQIEDRMSAKKIYNYKKYFRRHCDNDQYEFILGLNDATLLDAMTTIIKYTEVSLTLQIRLPLFLYLLNMEKIHIVQSIHERLGYDFLSSLNLKSLPTYTIQKLLTQIITTNDTKLLNWFVSKVPDAVNQRIVEFAITKGQVDVIEFLIRQNKTFRLRSLQLLTTALEERHFEVAKLLIKMSQPEYLIFDGTISLDSVNHPLNLALEKGYLEIVDLLLDRGTCKKDRALRLPSLAFSHKEIIELLIKRNFRLKASSFHDAITGGHTEIVKLFLNHPDLFNVPLNVLLKSSQIPNEKLIGSVVYKALLKKDAEILALLLQAEADPNTINYGEMTPLNYAIRHTSVEMIKLLLENGADTNKDERPSLFSAIEKHSVEIVELLLQHHANANILYNNLPPLFYAVLNGDSKIVTLLLAAGADSQVQTSNQAYINPIPIAFERAREQVKAKYKDDWEYAFNKFLQRKVSLLEIAQFLEFPELITILTEENNKFRDTLNIKLGLMSGAIQEYQAENPLLMNKDVGDILTMITSILANDAIPLNKMQLEIQNLKNKIQSSFASRLGVLSFLSSSSIDPSLIELKNKLITIIDLPNNVVKEKFTQRRNNP